MHISHLRELDYGNVSQHAAVGLAEACFLALLNARAVLGSTVTSFHHHVQDFPVWVAI